jgi:hypothetical protein
MGMERVIEILRQQLELLAERAKQETMASELAKITIAMGMLARDIKHLEPSGLNDFPDKEPPQCL